MCIVEGCSEAVVNLSRHLQSKRHGWSQESAQKALSYFNYRKRSSDVGSLRLCPLQKCMAVVKRMDNHLKRVHKFQSSDPEYAKFLKIAEKFDPKSIPAKVNFSPKKFIKNISEHDINQSASIHASSCNNIIVHSFQNDIKFSQSSLPKENTKLDSILENKFLNNSVLNEPFILDSESELSIIESEDENDELFVPENSFLPLNNNIKIVLDKFENFLVGPDNKRDTDSASRTVGDVQRYFQLVNTPHFENISKLFNVEIIRNKYISKLESNQLKAGSIKKYLFSLLDFSTFLLSDKEALILTECKKSEVNDIKVKLSMWRKTYNREDRKEFWRRQDKDYMSIITPSEVSSYLCSEKARQAYELFDFFKINQRPVTQAEYVVTRDHMMFEILIGTAHRSGVCANVTTDEFKMHEIDADGMYIIPVAKHKTFGNYGHAYIVLSSEKFQWLTTFVDKIRSQIYTKFKNVFVSWSGQPMSSGAISQQLGSLWKKSGIYQINSGKRNFCATLLRKSASTGVRDNNIGNEKEIARFMGHSNLTADKHYHTHRTRNTAVKSSNSIRTYFQNNLMDNNHTIVSSTLSKNGDMGVSMTPPSERKKWTKQEEDILKKNFTKLPTMSEIIEIMPSIGIVTTPKKFYDKVRSLNGSPVAKTNATPKRQKMFSREDVLDLYSNGNELIIGGPLSQERIEDVLKNSSIIKKYNWQQLRTRIVYERKKSFAKSKANEAEDEVNEI